MSDVRVLAAKTLVQVVDGGRSLNDLIPQYRAELDPSLGGFYQQLVYGALRHYLSIDELAHRLLNKPIQRKERVVHMLLVLGLYQLWKLDLPEHAAIFETVDATKPLKKPWAKGVLNAALRRFTRERDTLLEKLRNREGYPGWMARTLRQDYPDTWQTVLAHGNIQGPMTLRVNERRQSRDQWLARAETEGLTAIPCEHTPSAVTLAEAAPVQAIPGFADGDVSVQDEAAQQCTWLLDPQNGDRILDACAAPGGKTGHLLERADLDLTALDIDPERLDRVRDNLERLNLTAHLVAADASDLKAWWDGQPFDRILLDAPCSGSGVIRRHPDIKLLRKPKDVDFLTQVQAHLLKRLWTTLKPGGRLLYATCSVFQRENSAQIKAFLDKTEDARLVPLALTGDAEVAVGVQWLPQPGGHDGFYFALIEKTG